VISATEKETEGKVFAKGAKRRCPGDGVRKKRVDTWEVVREKDTCEGDLDFV